jgi:hypothetical protein
VCVGNDVEVCPGVCPLISSAGCVFVLRLPLNFYITIEPCFNLFAFNSQDSSRLANNSIDLQERLFLLGISGFLTLACFATSAGLFFAYRCFHLLYN